MKKLDKLENALFMLASVSMPMTLIFMIIAFITQSMVFIAISISCVLFGLLCLASALPIWTYNDYIQFEKPKKKERKDHR